MAHNYIIQWNCRGLRSNRDVELLSSKYSPAAICLQETLLKQVKHKHLNIIQHIIKVALMDMVESVFL